MGRHLVAECILQGRFKLRLLTRQCNALEHLSSDKITICEGDLMKPESINAFLQPDSTLIHLAYMNNSHDQNIAAAANLIKAVKQTQVKRVIHCSTAVVVGFSAKDVVTEETIPAPESEYEQTKYQIEKLFLSELPPVAELVILRPTEIIGPGGQGLQKMIKRLRSGKKYTNYLYHCLLKSRRFNYVSVHNVIAALLTLTDTQIIQKGEIYNISDDDDDDNNYAAVERIINENTNNKRAYYFDVGIPKSLLIFLFRFMPGLSSPDRVYQQTKIAALGYKKVMTLNSAITEILSKEGK